MPWFFYVKLLRTFTWIFLSYGGCIPLAYSKIGSKERRYFKVGKLLSWVSTDKRLSNLEVCLSFCSRVRQIEQAFQNIQGLISKSQAFSPIGFITVSTLWCKLKENACDMKKMKPCFDYIIDATIITKRDQSLVFISFFFSSSSSSYYQYSFLQHQTCSN